MPLGFSDAFVFIFNRSSSTNQRQRRPRLRRPVEISSPILHESLHFNVNAASAMNDPVARPESPGMFYLVSNKSGTGKTIVHRHRPRSPLEGNFDDLSPGPSTSKDFGLRISRPRKRPALTVRTSPPPSPKLDSPSLDSKYLWLDPVRATWNTIRRKNHKPVPVSENANTKGKQRAEDPVEEELVERETPKDPEIRAWVGSVADVQRSATYPQRQTEARSPKQKKTRRITDGMDGLRPGIGMSSLRKYGRPPPPAHNLEMINRQIIERSSDKTVELSTWKEHAEKEVRPNDAERISVYYVTADELELGEERGDLQVEWRYDDVSVNTVQRVPSSVTASKRVTADEIFSSKRKGSEVNIGVRRHGSISPSTSEKENSSGTDRKAASNGVISHPPRDNPKYSQSTPIEKDLPPFPFHATRRSGSTISSIKTDSSLQLETVLESCKPSLLHILPTLQRLGIRKIEHLRAVANLTPATRDKEIKEDVLRFGVTVMEWAVFVDKIFTL